MSAKDKKIRRFSSFKKTKREFIVGSHNISSNNRLLNTCYLC